MSYMHNGYSYWLSDLKPVGYQQNDCSYGVTWGDVYSDLEDYIEKTGKQYIYSSFLGDFVDDIKGDVEVYGANPEKGTTGTVKVTFNDGKTETSSCYEPDEFDPEYGVALCVLKHAMGGTARFYRVLRHGIKKYRRQVAAEEAEQKAKEEKEAVEKRQYEKRMKQKEKHDAKRAEKERQQKEAEREEKIDIISDAIVRAKQKMKALKRGR